MRNLIAVIIFLLAVVISPAQSAFPSAAGCEGVQFPHNSVSDLLSFYEGLIGKRVIHDSKLIGPKLSIMVYEKLPRKDAINLLECSLRLNGYSIVPVGNSMVKVVGPTSASLSEGLPLFTQASIVAIIACLCFVFAGTFHDGIENQGPPSDSRCQLTPPRGDRKLSALDCCVRLRAGRATLQARRQKAIFHSLEGRGN